MNESAPPSPGPTVTISVPTSVGELVGFDVPRVFANGVQVFHMGPNLILVFREQLAVSQLPTEALPLAETTFAVRNVVSVVLPREIALQVAQLITDIDAKAPHGTAS